MKKRYSPGILFFLFFVFLIGCEKVRSNFPSAIPSQTLQLVSSSTQVPTLTIIPSPTATHTKALIPTATLTKTLPPTATFTPTQIPQKFQPIFPPGYGQAGVAANHNSIEDPGLIHFDIGIPMDFVPEQDAILFPASGRIVEHYLCGDKGDSGECITIEPDPPLQGIDDLVLSIGRDPNDIKSVWYTLGHIFTFKTSGWVKVGEEAGIVLDRMSWSNIVAFVVRIRTEYDEFQVSPCELPNEFDWCDICYPGAAERNPCP